MSTGFETDNINGIHSYDDVNINKGYIQIRAYSKDTNISTGDNVAGKVLMPFTGTFVLPRAIVDDAGITGNTSIQIQKNSVDVLSTPIQIDTGETDSNDSVVTPVISDTSFTLGDIITIDIDEIQSGTAPKGLVVSLTFDRELG